MCLLLAKRLWFFVHSEKTLPLLPLLRSRPPQIIANDLSIVNIFWIRHSGSYSAAAVPWGEHGLCQANIWWPYSWNHKLNPPRCRRCNYPNKTGCFSYSPSISFCTKEISYVLGRTQFFEISLKISFLVTVNFLQQIQWEFCLIQNILWLVSDMFFLLGSLSFYSISIEP